MSVKVLSALTVLLLCLVPAFSSVQTLPAFVWGSGDYVNHPSQQLGLQASYEVYSSTFLTNAVFDGLSASSNGQSGALFNQTSLEIASDKLVSLFILGRMSRGDLARNKAASSLFEAVSKAASSIFLSDVEATHAGILDAITSQSGKVLQFGACGPEGEGLAPQQLGAELHRENGPVSGVVCEGGSSSDVVAELESQLRSARRPFVIVYAGQPERVAARPVARSLISTNSGILCDRKCHVQVRLFEVIILMVILLVALGAGLGMLHILDTPTRFEKEKKEVNRHQE